MQERAPRVRTEVRERHRRERIWAWLSMIVLIVSWDAAERLDHMPAHSDQVAQLAH
jgi:hypothetical protein